LLLFSHGNKFSFMCNNVTDDIISHKFPKCTSSCKDKISWRLQSNPTSQICSDLTFNMPKLHVYWHIISILQNMLEYFLEQFVSFCMNTALHTF
jgi:hypothetical protein